MPPHPTLGNTREPWDIGVSRQEPILEPGALESPASLEPTSMGKPGARLSSRQSSCWVTGEVMPLERPTKLELLEPSVAGNVMEGTAKAVSACAGGVLEPRVEEANLETSGLNSSLYPGSSFKVSLSITVLTSLGMVYAWPESSPFSFAIAVYVGCICDPVISVRILHLSHSNSMNYS